MDDVFFLFLTNKKEMKVTLLGGCVDESGHKDGQSNNSRFNYPNGITVDNKGIFLLQIFTIILFVK